MGRLMEWLARIAFASASLVLMGMSLGLVIYGAINVIASIGTHWRDASSEMLASIGYIVIAVAVFDVAKYFIEEEVIRSREMRSTAEARRSLTKFISIITIALFIEGLVLVFRVSREDIASLPYPTALLLVAIIVVIGLGAYQRMSAETEAKVESKDKQQIEEDER